MFPSYSQLTYNKINPKPSDGVEIIKCFYSSLNSAPISLNSIKKVLVEATIFSKIQSNKDAGSIFCDSCNTVIFKKNCADDSSLKIESSGSNFVQINRGKLCNIWMISMQNCKSSTLDGISIYDTEMNITGSNFTNSAATASTPRLQNTKTTGLCVDSVFSNNTSYYERALRVMSMEHMHRCIYNS